MCSFRAIGPVSDRCPNVPPSSSRQEDSFIFETLIFSTDGAAHSFSIFVSETRSGLSRLRLALAKMINSTF